MLQDVRHWGQSEEPGPLVYVLFDEWSIYFGRYYVAARVSPGLQVAPELRQAIWAVDPEIPVDEMLTMRQRVADSVAEPRFYSVLFVVFSGVALLLAAGGIYGSLLYAVGQRRRELGVGMALGACGVDILRLVLRQGLGQALAGIAIGTAAALAATRLLQSMVYGITTTDSVTYVAVAGLLGSVALVACLVPARRATAQDPVRSLCAD